MFSLFIIITPQLTERTENTHGFYKFIIKVRKPMKKLGISYPIMAIMIALGNLLTSIAHITAQVFQFLALP
tara:strand:+ start:171 stop:383 length:213 start_codon:yes stop_codon:yes gene_type:complete